MPLFLLLTALATAAPCLETTFEFVGQPECVELAYADGLTQLKNTCSHALLVDQSVQLGKTGGPAGLVQANTSTQIRDLSAFTMGMDGTLYRVRATVRETCEAPPPVAPQD